MRGKLVHRTLLCFAFLVDLATTSFHVIADQPAQEMTETDPYPDISLGPQSLHIAGQSKWVHTEMMAQQAGDLKHSEQLMIHPVAPF